MAYLLDVNVLIALTWPTHVHHVAARTLFDSMGREGWATCPLTQAGFVRVSSNPKLIRDAVRPPEAAVVLKRLTDLPGHRFWPDDLSVTEAEPFESLSLVGHRQVTDAYLLALARRHGAKLATLDKGLPALVSGREERELWIESIPVEIAPSRH